MNVIDSNNLERDAGGKPARGIVRNRGAMRRKVLACTHSCRWGRHTRAIRMDANSTSRRMSVKGHAIYRMSKDWKIEPCFSGHAVRRRSGTFTKSRIVKALGQHCPVVGGGFEAGK
jgi:hypothetical protein